jgi:hypothetical protein
MIRFNLRTQRLGPLPIINHFIQRAGLQEALDRYVPSDARIMPGRREHIIRQARERLARIRATLNGMDYLCSGTLLERMKMCGKPGCRCAQDPLARHGPYYL